MYRDKKFYTRKYSFVIKLFFLVKLRFNPVEINYNFHKHKSKIFMLKNLNLIFFSCKNLCAIPIFAIKILLYIRIIT